MEVELHECLTRHEYIRGDGGRAPGMPNTRHEYVRENGGDGGRAPGVPNTRHEYVREDGGDGGRAPGMPKSRHVYIKGMEAMEVEHQECQRHVMGT
jgi:hypothetical protein